MISSKNRFHGLGSLRFAYSKGRTVRTQYMGLRFAPNKRRKTYRAAVVVSKKVNKSAVVRNKIRRRVYEAVRANQAIIDVPLDLVFTIYSDTVSDMPYKELEKSVQELLAKAA